MKKEILINHIKKLLPLDKLEEEVLLSKITFKKLKRRQFLLQEGDVCRHYNFIVEGCMRMYMVDEKGTEHNLQFGEKNWWITDIGSFHSDVPTQLFIDALEPSEVLQIKKEDLIFIYTHFPKIDRYFRVLIENAFIKMQARVLQNISATAEEKYLTFLKDYPNLSNRISQIQIASYIGVTPEFLSKVRRSLMK